jgi:hypothetical protein
LLFNIGQHRLERFQVSVNVADDCPFQFTARLETSKRLNRAGKAPSRLDPSSRW